MANKVFHSSTVTFLDRTDERKLEVYISSNNPTVQIYNNNTDEYTPDWSVTNLKLTATIYLDSTQVTPTTVQWYTRIGTTETLVGSTASLTVSTNVLSTNPIITYICRATYQNVNAVKEITFARTDTGKNGKDGTSVNIKGTATSVSEISNTDYYTITYSGSDVSSAQLNDAYMYNGDLYVCVDSRDGVDYFINVGRIQGPRGEDAKNIIVAGDAQVFKVSKTNVITPNTISVTAYTFNTTATTWTYSTNGGQTFLSTAPTGVVRNGNVVTVTGSALTSTSLTIKASDGTYSDVFTIYKAYDGTDGTPGTPGQPASMAFLTNENISFVANSSGQVALTTFTTNIVAYNGTDKSIPIIGAITGLPSGMTVVPNKGTAYSNTTPATNNLTVADLYTTSAMTTKVDKTKLSNGDSFVVGNYLYIFNSTDQNFKCQSVTVQGSERPSTFVANNEIILTFSIANNSTLGSASSNNGTITIPVTSPVSTNLILSWSKINTGASGVGISSTTVTYGVSDTSSTQPSEWQSTIPTVADGKYLWTRTVIDYTDPARADTVTYTYAKQGTIGAQGNPGTSVAISSIQYQSGNSATTAPTGTWSNAVVAVADGSYLWTKTTFSDGKIAYGVAKQGASGRGVSSIAEYYLATTASSGVTTSTTGWTTTIQTIDATKKYLWNYELITYTDNTTSTTTPVIIGVFGNTGNAGKGIKSVTEYYLATTLSSDVTTSTTGWTTTIQTLTETNKYLWNYELITYTDNTTTTINPIIIGVYGDTGAPGRPGFDAVTFQVYSSNGYALSTNTPTVTLQTFAYVGDVAITADATYQWYIYNDTGWAALSDETNAYLTITRENVAFSKSYMCKMTFNGVEYTSVATIDDKNDANKVFTEKPLNYTAGDIWIVGVDYAPSGVEVGTLLRAEHTNATYEDSDWVTSLKYDKAIADLQENIETYNQYFSFDSTDGLKISAKDNNGNPSQFSTSLTNERLAFNYGDEAIAYINGTKMNIKEAEIESPLTVTGKYSGSTMLQAPVINIGNFSIIVESNGSLSIVANT